MKETGASAKMPDAVNPFPLMMGKGDSSTSPEQENRPPNYQEVARDSFAKYVWRWIAPVIQWINANNGVVTAIATAVIAALTWSISEDSKKQAGAAISQFEIMKSQLGEMKSSSEQSDKIIENYRRLADAAEAAQRAWIGPVTATMVPPVVNQSIKTNISYANSGKEAAGINESADFKVFSKEEWTNGAAAKSIEEFTSKCTAINSFFPTRTAYPTSGLVTYNMNIDTAMEGVDKSYLADQALIDGDKILAIRGCFVYFTAQKLRHSSFCYFYYSKQIVMPNMSICTVGGKSD
jgi:hypothetical protein